MSSIITAISLVMPGMSASFDPCALNPLADDFLSVSPLLFAHSVQRRGRPPKMFTGGLLNLPPITASGIDPHWLTELPFTARHYAASLTTEDEVTALILRCTDPTVRYDHAGLDEAIARMRAWAFGPAPDTTTPTAPAARRPKAKGAAARKEQGQALTQRELMELSHRGEFLPTTRPRTSGPSNSRGVSASTPRSPSVTLPHAVPPPPAQPDEIYRAIWPTTEGA